MLVCWFFDGVVEDSFFKVEVEMFGKVKYCNLIVL